MDRGELPSGFVKYHVVHDPIGAKVGNGGGVLAVMDELHEIYKSKLAQLKVLYFIYIKLVAIRTDCAENWLLLWFIQNV